MSRVTVYAFREDGQGYEYGEARNAMACALTIWDKIAKAYNKSEGLFSFDALWQAVGQDYYPRWVDVLLASTFDRVVVYRKDLPEVVAAWQRFHEDYIVGTGTDDTVKRVADILVRAAEDPEVKAVGFQQTSVAPDLWGVEEEGGDEYRIYNLSLDTGHWDINDSIGPKGVEFRAKADNL